MVFNKLAQETALTDEMREELRQVYVQALRSKGASGLSSFVLTFKQADSNGNGSLSFSEFKRLCKTANIPLTEEQIRMLFLQFDVDGNGSIDFDEFKKSMRGSMSAKRRNFVQLAFKKLDRHGSGFLDWETFTQSCNMMGYPDVKRRIQSADAVLQAWKCYFSDVPPQVPRRSDDNH